MLYLPEALFHSEFMVPFVSSSIGALYRGGLRPVLFKQDPEAMHDRFTAYGAWLGQHAWTRALTARLLRYEHPALRQRIAGVDFANPVGLAAGFDKNGYLVGILAALGFGFTEVGTVTWQAYAGNPPPRLYRLPRSRGIVVNYGLKNEGIDVVLQRLRQQYRPSTLPLGISLGKTNSQTTTTVNGAIEDSVRSLSATARSGLGEFYVINISCPNAFGGEPFTTAPLLARLLEELQGVGFRQPLFLKMPITISWEQFRSLLDVAVRAQVTGVIIGNLNKNHRDPHIREPIPPNVRGGVSGKPAWQLSNELISRTFREYGERLTIIGVGGIFSAADAYEKMRRGASLVQLITGMIFQGPQLIGEINRGLVQLLRRDGYSHISEVIGTYHAQR